MAGIMSNIWIAGVETELFEIGLFLFLRFQICRCGLTEVTMSRSFQSVILLVVVISAASSAGARQTPKGPPATPSSSEIERRYAGGNGIPSRRVQTRTEANGR